MSEKQLTALRLADLLDKIPSYGHTPTDTAAAAELRRQHALLEEMAVALREAEEYLRNCANSPEMAGKVLSALNKWEASK